MRFALVGPPQSGKSTLFSAITGLAPDPAQSGVERLATVKVPDPRLDLLAVLHKPKKYTEATLEFVDVPGISLSDPHGQAEFRRCMANLRVCDGLVAVVRQFESSGVTAYRNRIDPKADLDELHTELMFADLEQVVNRIERLEKQVAKGGKAVEADKRELALMQRIRECLEKELPVSNALHNDEEGKIALSFGFLTQKPLIVVINVSEGDVARPPAFTHPTATATLALSAEIEAEIAQLSPDDRPAFLADLGLSEPAKNRLIHACYDAAGLISFLTAGEEEVRAWTIRRGMSALEAAGKIHSDIQRGFIRAETVAYADLKAAGDMRAAKAAGKVRLEGKTYVVQDGDVILFRFNV
ncbi:MAG: redox-regulated ATPase YchF [Phycisphaerae bacterium]|nr:redox-regulated ATPase YchF [Phycisphaerae bacterium]